MAELKSDHRRWCLGLNLGTVKEGIRETESGQGWYKASWGRLSWGRQVHET